jgi:MoaA/NifB/PqqE/SkfB family radical SAM enzyme
VSLLRNPAPWRRLAAEAVDLALRLKPVRRWALDRGDEALYDFYCVKRFEGLPLGVQEFRHRAIMNLLRSLDRAVGDGRFSRRARLGLLQVFVGNGVVNARKNVAPFIEKHGYEPPSFLVVSPTQKCNLFCAGCYSASSSTATATLEYDTLARILREKRDRWGSYFTVISGGEPLMYRSQGKTLLDLFEEFRDTYFMFYTNGTLLDAKVAERLAQLGNVTPAISVEGFEKETDARRGKGVYRQIEAAMAALRDAGVPFGISLTATRENADTLLSEEIIRRYFDECGAIYAWMFHYMPIGRSYTVDMMVTPEQRKRMLDRQLDLMRNRGLFFIDFWNGGPMSGGCISAGKPGGYFHIDWNGDISPCVFIPYAVDNIYDVYRGGRDLTSVLDHPAFRSLREWQLEYAGRKAGSRTQNLFAPCPMRDHHEVARDVIVRFGARPMHEDAAQALADPQYAERMAQYGRDLGKLLDPVWEREVVSRESPKS